jgi:BirA family biotin operon repressor/biotin-[acetyl-CoA-carboxylase] ligase
MKAACTVLACLYDRREGFFALDELAGAAGLDRARLSGVLDELAREGYEQEVSPAHGVRLVRPVRPHAYLIERGLGTRRVGRSVICFDEVGSTNDVAWDSARREDADGLVVLAEWQRSGRGRQGRRWLSPPGANVLMSIVLMGGAGRAATPPSRAGLLSPPSAREDRSPRRKAGVDRATRHEALTIAAGLAVCEGIERAAELRCELKWPNDVLLDGAKVAGVLVETRCRGEQPDFVVGIGINANAAPPPDDAGRPAACLADRLGRGENVERIELVRAGLARLDEWVHRISRGQLDALHDRWLARCGMMNERVRVRCGEECYTGRALDISPLEGLILCCDDGRRVHLPAETSTLL